MNRPAITRIAEMAARAEQDPRFLDIETKDADALFDSAVDAIRQFRYGGKSRVQAGASLYEDVLRIVVRYLDEIEAGNAEHAAQLSRDDKTLDMFEKGS